MPLCEMKLLLLSHYCKDILAKVCLNIKKQCTWREIESASHSSPSKPVSQPFLPLRASQPFLLLLVCQPRTSTRDEDSSAVVVLMEDMEATLSSCRVRSRRSSLSFSTAHFAVSESSWVSTLPSVVCDASPQLLPTFSMRDLIVSHRTLKIQ